MKVLYKYVTEKIGKPTFQSGWNNLREAKLDCELNFLKGILINITTEFRERLYDKKKRWSM